VITREFNLAAVTQVSNLTMGCAGAMRSSARTVAAAIAAGAITPRRLPKPVQSAPARARPFTKNGRNWPLTPGNVLWQYPAMLGEPENQFSLTRAASSTCGRAKTNFLSVQQDFVALDRLPALGFQGCQVIQGLE